MPKGGESFPNNSGEHESAFEAYARRGKLTQEAIERAKLEAEAKARLEAEQRRLAEIDERIKSLKKDRAKLNPNSPSDQAKDREYRREIIALLEARHPLAGNISRAKDRTESSEKSSERRGAAAVVIPTETAQETAEKSKDNSGLKKLLGGVLLGLAITAASVGIFNNRNRNKQTAAASSSSETAISSEIESSSEIIEDKWYNYDEYLDRSNKEYYNAFGYNKEEFHGDEEATKREMLKIAAKEPEALASMSKDILTDIEQEVLGIKDMDEVELEKYMSDPTSEDAEQMNSKLYGALESIMYSDTIKIEFGTISGDVYTEMIGHYGDVNHNNENDPQDFFHGQAEMHYDDAKVVNIYREERSNYTKDGYDSKWVHKSTRLENCGYQKERIKRAPHLPIIEPEEPEETTAEETTPTPTTPQETTPTPTTPQETTPTPTTPQETTPEETTPTPTTPEETTPTPTTPEETTPTPTTPEETTPTPTTPEETTPTPTTPEETTAAPKDAESLEQIDETIHSQIAEEIGGSEIAIEPDTTVRDEDITPQPTGGTTSPIVPREETEPASETLPAETQVAPENEYSESRPSGSESSSVQDDDDAQSQAAASETPVGEAPTGSDLDDIFEGLGL